MLVVLSSLERFCRYMSDLGIWADEVNECFEKKNPPGVKDAFRASGLWRISDSNTFVII